MNDQPVVVIPASARQGLATVRALLNNGHAVRALLRDRTRSDARQLADAGAELLAVGLDDTDLIRSALVGAKGLVLAQPGFISKALTPKLGPDDELRRGRTIFELAVDVHVAHTVYTSSISADRPDTNAALQPKHALEKYLVEVGLSATILRPVGFMENHTGPARGMTPDGTMTTPAPPDIPEQLIAVRDIGRFVALVFDDPNRFRGVDLNIAADERTPPQIAAAIGRATGRKIAFRQTSLAEVSRQHPERATGLASLYGPDRAVADIAQSRTFIADLMTFEQWLASPDSDGLRKYLSGGQ